MGREIVLFSSKEPKARKEVSAFLRDLANRLDEGRVILRQGDSEIVLDLPDQLVMELKIEDEEKRRKGTQHSLEVELKWYDGQGAPGGVELA